MQATKLAMVRRELLLNEVKVVCANKGIFGGDASNAGDVDGGTASGGNGGIAGETSSGGGEAYSGTVIVDSGCEGGMGICMSGRGNRGGCNCSKCNSFESGGEVLERGEGYTISIIIS